MKVPTNNTNNSNSINNNNNSNNNDKVTIPFKSNKNSRICINRGVNTMNKNHLKHTKIPILAKMATMNHIPNNLWMMNPV